MEKSQINVIVGLIAGMQAAMVHLVKVLDKEGVVAKEKIASCFRTQSCSVPAKEDARSLTCIILGQIADGIEIDADPTRPLLRLIQGNKP